MPVTQQSNFVASSLAVNDIYVVIVRPVSVSVQGVSTSICGLVGTAAWGPLNTPLTVGSPQELSQNFGPLRNKPNDMPTDALILLRAGVPDVECVRVSDGTDAAATAPCVSASTGTVTVGGTFSAGTTINVTVAGNLVSYLTVAGDTNLAGVAASLALALNSNATFKLSFEAVVLSGSIVTIVSSKNDNTTTLTTSASGGTVTTTASGGTLTGGGTSLGTWNALWTGDEGNYLSWQATKGAKSTPAARTWDVTIFRTGAVNTSETFKDIPQATFSASLSSALLNGQSSTRGPSELARFTSAGGTTAPHQQATAFTGGLNGDVSVLTDAQQMGSDVAEPATGMYSLRGRGVQHIGLCGNTNSTSWSGLLSFAKQNGMLAYTAFPTGTTTTAAIAAKVAAGIDDPYITFDKDFVQFNDTYNGLLRMLSPMPFVMGRKATLRPNESHGNKPIDDIQATERTLQKKTYQVAETDKLTRAGIGFITNPCPGGAFFGRRHGLNASSDNAVNGAEYTTMTNFLAYSLVGAFGSAIDKIQTQAPRDPLRVNTETKLRNFLGSIGPGTSEQLIEAYNVDMSFGAGKVNTPQSVTDGFMVAEVPVKYMSVVRFFVLRLIGGKTVEVKVS
jgi:hypothetical protein